MTRIVAMTALVAMAGSVAVPAQQKTDTSGTSGPRWESGKKNKPRDPNTRNVEGTVRLPSDAPAEGAVVKLKNLKTLQVRSFITQADGKYHFYGLSTNLDYELIGEFKGYESSTRSLSVFDNRLDAIVNLKLDHAKPDAKPSEAKAETPKQ